jgi:hypothetical protein
VRASAAAIEAAAAAVEEAAAGCDDIGGRHRHRRSSWARAVRSARSRELEAVDHAENAKAALASLQDGLSEAMAEDDRAQRAIQSAVAAVLRRGRCSIRPGSFRREFLKRAYSVNPVRSFLTNDMLEELQRLWIFISPENTAVEALKADADAALSEP